MQGRFREGWYQDPVHGPDYVTKISHIGPAWIETLYRHGACSPCACGTVLTKTVWSRLTTTTAPEGYDTLSGAE